MKITVLERGSMQSAAAGWLASRSLQEAAPIEDIARIDASVNELPTALLHVYCMILERELWVTPRSHVIWARTSRVDDVSQFTTPKAFEERYHEEVRQQMRSRRDMGQPQDTWRMMLPLCANTSFTARVSFRDLIRHAKYFDRVAGLVTPANPKLGEYLSKTASTMLQAAASTFSLPDRFVADAFNGYKPPPLNAYKGPAADNCRVTYGDFVGVYLRVPVALRAQLVRHRELMFTDDLVELLCYGAAEQSPIFRHVNMHVVATKDAWRHVLSNRTCWMAQQDLWKTVVDAVDADMRMLPCHDGRCPYAEDAKQRLAGNDPGAPCPRHAHLTNHALSGPQIAAVERHMATLPEKQRAFWYEQQDKVAKWEPCPTCPFPNTCTAERHCDATFNGYR